MSAGIITMATPLANGVSINLHFVVGVQQTGNYRFFVNVEALTNPPSRPNTKLIPNRRVANKN